jgi:ABC-2 type transport system ATP-binding protein
MRKKLEVATALLGEPEVLLLDEPTTGLDPGVRKNFLDLLHAINEQGTTILLVTHIGEDAEIASRIGFMVDGEIIVEDRPDVLKEQSGLQRSVLVDVIPRDQNLSLLLAGLDDDCIVIEHEDCFEIVCDKAVELIPTILERLRESGYEVVSIVTSHPSLEDIFHRLIDVPVGGEAL